MRELYAYFNHLFLVIPVQTGILGKVKIPAFAGMTSSVRMTRYIFLLLTLLFSTIFLYPSQSLAAITLNPQTEATTADLTNYLQLPVHCKRADGEYSQAIVRCVTVPVKKALLKPGDGILAKLGGYFNKLIYAVLTLALIVLAVRIISGDVYVWPRVIAFAVRAGVIITLSTGVVEYGTMLFDIMDEVIALPLGGAYSPFVAIDAFVGKILGFTGGPSSIKDGLVGLIEGSLFAKGFGILLSLAGAAVVFSILVFTFNVVYLYLSSFMAVGFLAAILPLLIPLYIFVYSEHMLLRWMDMYISNILTPTFLFLFLSLFLGSPAVGTTPAVPSIFQEYVDGIFTELGPDYLKRCLRDPQPITPSWMITTDSTSHRKLSCLGQAGTLAMDCAESEKDNSAIPSFVDPTASQSIYLSPLKVRSIDCGENDKAIKDKVFKNLMIILFLTVLMNSTLQLIPELAKGIGRGTTAAGADATTVLSRAIGTLKK